MNTGCVWYGQLTVVIYFQVLVSGLRGEVVRVYSEFVKFQVPKQLAGKTETASEEQYAAQCNTHIGAGESALEGDE